MIEDYAGSVAELRRNIQNVWEHLDAPAIDKKIQELEQTAAKDGFWDDAAAANDVMQKIKQLKGRVEPWRALLKAQDDLDAMMELAQESGDSAEGELKAMYQAQKERFDTVNVQHLLSGEVDINSAFLSVHAGAGGTEAEDWTGMLSRMYARYAQRHGMKCDTVDMEEGEGGVKSMTMQVSGDYAYGYLKGEAGIHRLVRISPFDAQARRHTSFASVYVYPMLDDTVEVNIDPKDLRVDTYRSGGKGGQHLNKTESAVRFTHIPTGIVVACQSERSQLMNRATAMSILRSRLYEYYKQEKDKENSKYNADKKDISWGNQIRSYVFQPYTMVKDHRTKCETSDIQAVMDGDIEKFIDEWLIMASRG